MTEDVCVPQLHIVNFQYADKVDLQSEECVSTFRNALSMTHDNITEKDIVTIERCTRGQHSNEHWHEARKQRITSSHFGQVVKRKISKPDNLLKYVMSYEQFDNKYVKWGRDHEPAARRMYGNKQVKGHENFCVAECGFLVNRLYPHLGSSPDGLVSCTCCGEGLLEIKCPSSEKWKFLTPEECSKDPAFFCALNDDKLSLKINHNYYYQVQGQLAISNRIYCDFVVWTLKGMSVQRIEFNHSLWSNMLSKLNSFYLHAVLPELYSARVKTRTSTLFRIEIVVTCTIYDIYLQYNYSKDLVHI